MKKTLLIISLLFTLYPSCFGMFSKRSTLSGRIFSAKQRFPSLSAYGRNATTHFHKNLSGVRNKNDAKKSWLNKRIESSKKMLKELQYTQFTAVLEPLSQAMPSPAIAGSLLVAYQLSHRGISNFDDLRGSIVKSVKNKLQNMHIL